MNSFEDGDSIPDYINYQELAVIDLSKDTEDNNSEENSQENGAEDEKKFVVQDNLRQLIVLSNVKIRSLLQKNLSTITFRRKDTDSVCLISSAFLFYFYEFGFILLFIQLFSCFRLFVLLRLFVCFCLFVCLFVCLFLCRLF
jgi:hypothetical protein